MAFLGQGLVPRPTVKKKCLSTFLGTLAGNLALARVLNFPVKFATKAVTAVPFVGGRVVRLLILVKLLLVVVVKGWYWRMAAVVELSKVPRPVK